MPATRSSGWSLGRAIGVSMVLPKFPNFPLCGVLPVAALASSLLLGFVVATRFVLPAKSAVSLEPRHRTAHQNSLTFFVLLGLLPAAFCYFMSALWALAPP